MTTTPCLIPLSKRDLNSNTPYRGIYGDRLRIQGRRLVSDTIKKALVGHDKKGCPTL